MLFAAQQLLRESESMRASSHSSDSSDPSDPAGASDPESFCDEVPTQTQGGYDSAPASEHNPSEVHLTDQNVASDDDYSVKEHMERLGLSPSFSSSFSR